ncbi:hypothetical protein M2161_001821 [Streptomyces sp. SAI-133]|uniref:hypothetical protein n=1 Tax=Streptomyces sp. SAI-218 TaxID=3377736 RepID=UPI00247CF83D|nr:hypothetical protein [Streptomyces sp. SAI-133]
MFVSGDDTGAKKAVSALLVSFGWPEASVLDLGDITSARGAEMLLPIWLRLYGALGRGDFNFHVQGARSGGQARGRPTVHRHLPRTRPAWR